MYYHHHYGNSPPPPPPHTLTPSLCSSQSDPEYLSVQDIAMVMLVVTPFEQIICYSILQINLCYSELKLDSLQRQSSHTHSPPPLLTKSLSFSQLACSGGERERKGMIEYTLRGGCGYDVIMMSLWCNSKYTLYTVYWCLYKMKTLYRDMTGAIIELKKVWYNTVLIRTPLVKYSVLI